MQAKDFSKMSDEDLENIINSGSAASSKNFSQMSDEELQNIIGMQKSGPEQQLDMIRQKHPYITKMSEAIAQNPMLRGALESITPATEFTKNAISGAGFPDFAKNFLQGSSEIARGIGNIAIGAGRGVERLLGKKELTPYIQNLHLNEYPTEQRNQSLQSLMGFAGNITPYVAAGGPLFRGGKALIEDMPYLKNLPEYLKPAIAGAESGAIMSPDERAKGAAFGGGLTAAGQAAGKGYKYLKEGYDTKKSYNNILEEIKNIAQKTQESGGNIKEAQYKTADYLKDKMKDAISLTKENTRQVQRLFPNVSESKANSQLVSATQNMVGKLKKDFEIAYNPYSQSGQIGQKNINNPFSPNEIDEMLGSIKQNPMTKHLNESISEKYIDASPYTGFYTEIHPPEMGNVSDYVHFYRQTRDLGRLAAKEAKGQNITTAEKSHLRQIAKQYGNLSSATLERVKSSLTKNEFENFERIQKSYADLYFPFIENPSLRNAAFNEKITGNMLKHLTQPKYTELYNLALNTPSYREALARSLTRGTKNPLYESSLSSQATSIIKDAKSNKDLFNLFSPEQKAALNHHIANAKNQETVGSLLKQVKQKGFDQRLYGLEREQAKSFSPKLKQHLENIERAQNEEQALKNTAKKLSMKESDLKEQLEYYKKHKKLAKIGLSIAGIKNILPGISKIFG
jgi:hypothetical protein